MNIMGQKLECGKALVIGAGIAGLMTARVLSDYYEEVLIVERDEFPTEPESRSGVPQSFHPHRVLPRGRIILERYFPGYVDTLIELGAQPTQGESTITVNKYGSLVNQPADKDASSSRVLLEWVLYQRVREISNVRFLANTEVKGLVTSDDLQTVTGIYTKSRDELKTESSLTADLVVDAAGRSSKVIKWLEALGQQVPEPEILKVPLGYSTRYYKIPSHVDQNWKSFFYDTQAGEGVSAVMVHRIEDHIAGATIASTGGEHYPSTNVTEFEEELKQLVAPEIAEALEQLEPYQGPRGYRLAESVRQHFEKLESWPSGLLVLGDALCSFDPIYGQGMTVASIEAETLASCLEEQLSNPQPKFELRVLHRMQQALEPAWWLSSVSDLRWRGVEHVYSEPLKGITFAQKYIDLYTKKATALALEEGNRALFFTLFMMNGLVLPPREFFNAHLLTMLLNDNGSAEEQRLRAELAEEDPQKFQARIDELIPSFEAAYDDRLKEMLAANYQHAAAE
ncbi:MULTISPECIES: FAD-dependent oxidoreductase [unclassified Paenibacillus]|uniref:FAD-dependent oxidoreductase n=1 Tax=unclassified Paenibacillus TaxID=185978 RepID=UPI00369A7C6D